MARALVAAGVAGILLVPTAAQAAKGQDDGADHTLVSVTNEGEPANGPSYQGSSSFSGRYVAFTSDASNLVPGDSNEASDVFVRDLVRQTTTRVSVGSDGAQADGPSSRPAISGNGRYIAFDSTADNLVPGDTDGASDIFLRDTKSGTTQLVSVGAGVVGPSRAPAISRDGNVVAFISGPAIVIRNLSAGTSTVAGEGERFALSSDGRHIAWTYVGGIFTKDLVSGHTVTVSPSDRYAGSLRMSADGRYVIYVHYCCMTLLGGYSHSLELWDRSTGTIMELASAGGSADPNECLANACTEMTSAAISANGRVVMFTRDVRIGHADDLIGAFASANWRTAGEPEWQRVTPTAAVARGGFLSGNGHLAGFLTLAALVPADTNGFEDVYARTLPVHSGAKSR